MFIKLRQLLNIGSSSVVIRHRAVKAASCRIMNSSFASRVPLRASSQKLLLKRTTAGRRILSFHFTLWQLQCGDEASGCHRRQLPQNEL